jgi:hypothetical protein
MTLLDMSYSLQNQGKNIVPSTIYRWEKGQSSPNGECIAAMCDALGERPENFFTN